MALVASALFLLLASCVDRSAGARIEKAKTCDKTEAWFHQGHSYTYRYESVVDFTVTGITDSKTGFRLGCDITITVPRRCELLVSIRDCNLEERFPGAVTIYRTIQKSRALSDELGRYPVYIKMNRGEIWQSEMIVNKGEKKEILNLKRGIISAFQLKIQAVEDYEKPVMETSVLGTCPTQYSFPEDKPGIISTKKDVVSCDLQVNEVGQMSIFYLIKSVLERGPSMEGDSRYLRTLINSWVDCDYNPDGQKHLESIHCIQHHHSRMFSHNGTIYASANANISQTFQLVNAKSAKRFKFDRSMDDREIVSIKFDPFDMSYPATTTKEIYAKLEDIINAYMTDEHEGLPVKFKDFVLLLRAGTTDEIHGAMAKIWVCKDTMACTEEEQAALLGFMIDGLLSCGSEACIIEFAQGMAADKIQGMKSKLFLVDLAMHHEPTEAILMQVLGICKVKPSGLCVLTMSIMVNKFANKADLADIKKTTSAVYFALQYVRLMIGDSCKPEAMNIPNPMLKHQVTNKLILAFKALNNMGKAAQTVYDALNTNDAKQLVTVALICAKSKVHPKAIRKTAILALESMDHENRIVDTMKGIASGRDEDLLLRITAFKSLTNDHSRTMVKTLLKMALSEEIEQVKNYMLSFIISVLETKNPDRKSLRDLWLDVIKTEGTPLPKLDQVLWKQSQYLEFSRQYTLPLTKIPFGGEVILSLVYDPASFLPRSIVVNINGNLKGVMYNVVEFGTDLEGFDSLLKAFISPQGDRSAEGISNILASFMGAAGQPPTESDKQTFTHFSQTVVTELKKLIKDVNFPKATVPKGQFYVKVRGYDVAFTSFADIIFRSQKSRQEMFNPQVLIHKIVSGWKYSLTRGILLADTEGEFGNVCGHSMRVHAHMSAVLTGSVGIKGDLQGYIAKTGPSSMSFDLKGSLAAHSQTYGYVGIPGYYKAGLDMVYSSFSSGVFKEDVLFTETVTKQAPGPGQAVKKGTSTVTFTVDRKPATYMKLRSDIYLVHGDSREKVTWQPKYTRTINKCTSDMYNKIMGRRLCLDLTFANTSMSRSHPYFPMNGPLKLDITSIPESSGPIVYTFKIGSEESKTGTPAGASHMEQNVVARFSGPGASSPDVEYEFLFKRNGSVDIVPQADGKIVTQKYDMTMGEKLTYNGEVMYGYNFGVKIASDTKHTQAGAQLLNRDVGLSVGCNAPKISYVAHFDNSRINLDSRITTKFHSKYYCDKSRSIFYNLHRRLDLAEQNGDITEYTMSNDYTYNEQGGRSSDTFHLEFPGQHVMVTTDRITTSSGFTRDASASWLDKDGVEQMLTLKSSTQNRSSEGNWDYEGHMELERPGKYDVTVHGTVSGSLKDFSINHKISFQRKLTRRRRSLAGIYGKLKGLEEKASDMVNNLEEIEGEIAGETGTSHGAVGDQGGLLKLLAALTANKAPNVASIIPAPNGPIIPLDSWEATANFNVKSDYVTRTNVKRTFTVDVLYPRAGEMHTIKAKGSTGKLIEGNSYNLWALLDADVSYLNHKLKGGVELSDSKERRYFGHNWTLSSLDTGVTNRAFIAHAEYMPHRSFELGHHLTSPRLNASFDVTFGIAPPLFSHTLTSKASCVWPLFSHYYSVRRTMDKTGSNNSVSFAHALLKGSLNTTINMALPNKGMTIVHDSVLAGQQPGMPTYTIHGDYSHSAVSLPSAIVTIDKKDVKVITVDWRMVHPKLVNATVTRQNVGEGNVFIANWEAELVDPFIVQNNIRWTPELMEKAISYVKQRGRRYHKLLLHLADTMKKNYGKNLTDMTVPFLNKTVRAVAEVHLYPRLKQIQPYIDGFGMQNYMKPSEKFLLFYNKFKLLIQGIRQMARNGYIASFINETRLTDRLYTRLQRLPLILANAIYNPPPPIAYYVLHYLIPAWRKVKAENRFSFTCSHSVIIDSFLSRPRMTRAQSYFISRIRRVFNYARSRGSYFPQVKKTAILFPDNKIRTFDGHIYAKPGSIGTDCVHVLAADYRKQSIILFQSGDSFIVLTNEIAVRVNHQNEVFVNKSTTAVELPLMSWNGAVVVVHDGPDVRISTKYGYGASCCHGLCAITSDTHYNDTVGLLGTINNEPSTDTRDRTGVIRTATHSFLNSFEVSGISSCQISPVAADSQCPDKVSTKQCMDLFAVDSIMAPCLPHVPDAAVLAACTDEVNSCPAGQKSAVICGYAMAYQALCRAVSVRVEIPESCRMCTESSSASWMESRSQNVADIVFVVSLHNSMSKTKTVQRYLAKFIERLPITNVQFGLVTYGGVGVHSDAHVSTMATRRFGTKNSILNALNDLKTLGTETTDALHAITIAVNSYGFRANAKRYILLMTETGGQEYESEALNELLNKHSITFNVFSNYNEIGNKRGIKWDGSPIRAGRNLQLPKDIYTNLAVATKGSILDLKLVVNGKNRQIDQLLRHIKEQSTKSCHQCTCASGVAGHGIPVCEDTSC